ncbi:MAG: hypothetical protein PHY43_04865 [Verrucomicrobiales bacterium]|nr:hypothetical protein [Verrucomicrobiales bacterium]
MKSIKNVIGIEINPKFVGALFTERIENSLRVFCFYTNGETSQFDMPADENLGNLQNFHSKLNMDEACSSVIVDEVVQGRVYVSSEGSHWLYTLLSTPGNVLPPFNADICNLAWQCCWRSQTADVLEYGKPGDPVHCFAIRTQISENDATRLVKDSNAFTNPLSVQKKQPHRWLYLNIGAVLAFLGILIVLTLFHSFKKSANDSVQSSVTTEATAETRDNSFYLLYNHQISGPYAMKIITSMNAGGLLNSETMCRPENSAEWISLATLFPSQLQK